MGTMNKLRENTGVVLWILVISFGVIWVLQDSGAFDTAGAPSRDLIVVDGDAISYEEYQGALENQMNAYRQQLGDEPPPQQVDRITEQVFNALVENRLREHEMDRLGITVTDEEVYDMVLGENPHPIIVNYFGDGEGNVDQALLQNFIDNPEAKQQWIQIEDYLRSERRRQKLNQLIGATVRVSNEDVQDEYVRRNRTADARFVALRYAALPDDSIEVTDSDLRDYYDEHRDDYERKRSYTVKYAALSTVPSPADTAALLQDLEGLKSNFASAEDDSVFLSRYASERPYSSAYFRRDELDAPIAQAVFENPEPGRLIGPVLAGEEGHLVKILDVRPAEEQAIKARHILFRAPEDDDEQRAAARQEALEVRQELQSGGDFAALAREHSDDPGSARNGGDLGWFGPGRMVEAFEDAAFDAPIGRVLGPVETRFGYHLIEVTDRSDQEVQLADYAQKLRPSPETLNNAEETLDDLIYYASESGDFEDEVQRLNLELQQVQIEEDQRVIPGINYSSSLMNFLKEAEEGDISEVIELNEQFIAAYVEEIQPAGYRPFEEVKSEIEPRVKVEKKKAIQRERMSRALQQHGFDGLADALGIAEREATSVSFSSPTVPVLGRDPIFAGTVLGLEEGAVSGVVDGENGVFVAKVTALHEPAPMTDQQRQQLQAQLQNRRSRQLQSQWIAEVREQADIEDNRRQLLQ